MLKTLSSGMALAGIAAANYSSGEVKTWETFTYGRFTVRMAGPNKNGTVASFFTYWNGPNWTQEGWNEIDVEIVPSISGNPFSTNIIWQWQQQDQTYCSNFWPGSDFHEYVIEWAPEYVQWTIDGNVCRRTEGTTDVHFLNKDQHLMMNFWTPTFAGWGDNFNDWDMPWYTKYDYVKVEKYNSSTGGFDLYWQDDFDSFDGSRWQKSDNWSFESNSSTFYTSQVYTEDGNLVLKMENPYASNDTAVAEHLVQE